MTQMMTIEETKEDGRSRVVRTVGQGGFAFALVTIAQAALQGKGWLHGELSPTVFGSYVTVLTGVSSAFMNISRLRGKL